ncbi:MAG: DUF1549 and DUF1553 domain-containing protein [Pirellulaceae bacterium]
MKHRQIQKPLRSRETTLSLIRVRSVFHPWLLFLASLAVVTSARGDEPGLEPIDVGQPTRLEVFPPAVKLAGPRSQMHLVVTGHYADGSVQDLTRVAQFATSSAAVATVELGVALPHQDGGAEIVVAAGGQEAKLPVEASSFGTPRPISFEWETLAALSKQSCNSGACHGSPSGKGGFRLSLRAFDAAFDALTLIREDLGRRTNPLDPDESLLLAKPMMKLPHGGGLKLKKSDAAYAVLRQWIAEGCQADPDGAVRCVKIEVYPPSGRVLKRPAHTQQLCVLGHFSDGSVRDVTDLAYCTSSDNQVADVTPDGLVIGHDRGEAAIIVKYMEHVESCFLTFVKDIPGFVWNDPPTANYVDEHVHAKLRQLQYVPSGLCSDEEFLRRVHLDVVGQLPTIEATQAFLADASADKRSRLIAELLERPEHAKFWALKWGDLLRLTSTQIGGSGVYKYHRWLERAFETNMPYDQFAAELISASGSTLDNPAANFYRTATDTLDSVESVSQVFLGARLQCAKCHNHPFERWTQDNYYGMAAFFNRVQRKKSPRADELLVYMADSGEVTQPRTGKQMKPWLPGKGEIDPPAGADRRDPFVAWLTAKDNALVAKVEANRLWSQVLGRGIVDPPDDFRDSNPPSNAALLDALAKDFAEHGFDRKHLLRVILNSRTYQADFRANDLNKDDAKYFSHYQPRLLSAEQLLDAICATTDLPEAFAGLPAGTKATQLPAPDLAKHEFLKIFGQPERQTVCACERAGDSNLGMAIQFFNGPLIYGKLRDANNRFRKLLAAGKPNEEIITELYLAAVCRKPADKEMQASLAHIAAKGDQVVALEDIAWAILNTNEFLFQH